MTRWLRLCLFTAYLVQVPRMIWAQRNMCGHSMETKDETPPGELPVPRQMTGIGNVHMQITATPEAQMWFDQGLNLLHDFWDYESSRAFEQSVRADPQCAMCYWGLYKAQSFYHSTTKGYAAQSLARAMSLKDLASERESLYIEASAAQEDSSKSSQQSLRSSQSLELWRKLVKEYPEDTQGRIFLAGLVDQQEALTILQAVLKDEPGNSAANHYYIHDLEGADHPEQALHSAQILASLAPASGHMVHMPGHIYFRLGDYARAEQAFSESMQVDERYMREQHVEPDNDWNYVHNLMYAIANLMEEGKLIEATALSAKLIHARGELESTLYLYSTRDSISRLDPRLPVALRTADWAQVITLLKASAPPARWQNLELLARQLLVFATGMSAVETGDLPKAEQASAQFEEAMSRNSTGSSHTQPKTGSNASAGDPPKLQVLPDALLQPLLRSLAIMSLELRGSLLAAQKKTTEAKKLFLEAAIKAKALGYREPPNYIRPVGEMEGAALTASGDWADARVAYQEALLERPRSGLVLYGIAPNSEKSGDSAAATKQYSEFLAAWKNADPALMQLTHAREYLAKHPSLPEIKGK